MLRHLWGRILLISLVMTLVPTIIVVAALVVADWREARHRAPGVIPAVAHAVDRGDRLHYVGHLVLGRLFDACPCTESIAADQYHRADQHARTERQQALVTTARPDSMEEVPSDVVGIVMSGLRWGQGGAGWLLGRLTRT